MKYEPLSDNPLKIILHNKEYKKLPEELITYTSGTFYSDESNNLRNSMKFFQNLIEGEELSNIDTAIEITKILEEKGLKNDQFEDLTLRRNPSN
jgi:hypothetical protein